MKTNKSTSSVPRKTKRSAHDYLIYPEPETENSKNINLLYRVSNREQATSRFCTVLKAIKQTPSAMQPWMKKTRHK